MAYRRGDALIRTGRIFMATSNATLRLVALLGRLLVPAMYEYRVTGKKILAAAEESGGPIVYVANHCLPLDSLIHGLAIQPRLTWFTIIEETVMTPILGNLVRLLGGIPVPTDLARLGDIDRAVHAAIRARGSVFFYAEGECFLRNQEIKPLKAGAFYYAMKEGARIVPIVSVLKAAPARGRRARSPRLAVEVRILPPRPPPPPRAPGRLSADLHHAIALARDVRAAMQAEIDSRGGDKTLYRGPMPRIRGVNDRPR